MELKLEKGSTRVSKQYQKEDKYTVDSSIRRLRESRMSQIKKHEKLGRH
jgi:hypothetical protein